MLLNRFRSLPRNSVVRLTDCAQNDLQYVEGPLNTKQNKTNKQNLETKYGQIYNILVS